MFEPFGKIRVGLMKKLMDSCQPEDKVICDLGAGNPAITDDIICKKRIRIDINKQAKPDIICDLTEGIPLSDNSINTCVASEILEHIYNSKYFINEIARVLKKGGILILSCPNICSLKYRIAFLIGKIPSHAAKADMTYFVDKPGHIRDYNFEEVEKLLKNFNFRVIERKSDGLSFKSRTIIPRWLLPKTFQNAIIIKAEVIK